MSNNTELVSCKNGHAYDSSVYESCPWCEKKRGFLFGRAKRKPHARGPVSPSGGETEPMSFLRGGEETEPMAPVRNGDETEPIARVHDADHTGILSPEETAAFPDNGDVGP